MTMHATTAKHGIATSSLIIAATLFVALFAGATAAPLKGCKPFAAFAGPHQLPKASQRVSMDLFSPTMNLNSESMMGKSLLRQTTRSQNPAPKMGLLSSAVGSVKNLFSSLRMYEAGATAELFDVGLEDVQITYDLYDVAEVVGISKDMKAEINKQKAIVTPPPVNIFSPTIATNQAEMVVEKVYADAIALANKRLASPSGGANVNSVGLSSADLDELARRAVAYTTEAEVNRIVEAGVKLAPPSIGGDHHIFSLGQEKELTYEDLSAAAIEAVYTVEKVQFEQAAAANPTIGKGPIFELRMDHLRAAVEEADRIVDRNSQLIEDPSVRGRAAYKEARLALDRMKVATGYAVNKINEFYNKLRA